MKNNTRKYITIFAIGGLSFILGAFITKTFDKQPITIGVVQEAQKLNGFSFTQAQADSMLGNLNQFSISYDSLRKLKMPNSVVPALNFNPVPVALPIKMLQTLTQNTLH